MGRVLEHHTAAARRFAAQPGGRRPGPSGFHAAALDQDGESTPQGRRSEGGYRNGGLAPLGLDSLGFSSSSIDRFKLWPAFACYGRTKRRSTYCTNAWAFFGFPGATDHGLRTT